MWECQVSLHSLTLAKKTFKDNYSLLAGSYPASATDVVLIVDGNNNTNINALKNLGFDVKEDEKLDFDDIVGTTFKLVNNNTYYKNFQLGILSPIQIMMRCIRMLLMN